MYVYIYMYVYYWNNLFLIVPSISLTFNEIEKT